MRQPSCAEISRLPKITEGIRAINFRRTTPGSISRVIHAHKPPPPHSVVDPAHPALGYRAQEFLRAFPWRLYDGFKLRALPHGVLDSVTTPFPSPPYKLSRGDGGGRSVNMSLLDVAPRDIGGHVVRQDNLRKIKTAISLIVTRGADVEGPKGKEKVVFKGADAPDAWIMPKWVYIIHPYDQVYNMPYTRLIPALRDSLQMIVATGTRLEQQWAKMKQVAAPAPGSQRLPPRPERLSQPRSERLPPSRYKRLPSTRSEQLPSPRSERLHPPPSERLPPPYTERLPPPRPPKPPPSKPPPEPTKKEQAVQLSFTQVLQRLSRPASALPQSQQGSEANAPSGPPVPQKPSTLGSILDRHLKGGLADSPWGSPLEGPYVAVREPGSKPPDTPPRRDGLKEP